MLGTVLETHDMAIGFPLFVNAHAPGQLEWQPNGCARAAECEVPADRIVNTWSADELVQWVGARRRNAADSRAAFTGGGT